MTTEPFVHPRRPSLPPPVVKRRTELDDYLPRPEKTQAEREQETIDAFAKLGAQDFDGQAWSKEDYGEAIELLASMCGLRLDECFPSVKKSLRVAARFMLNNITLAESQHVSGEMLSEAKTREWWKEHGTPMSAAKTVVLEMARAKSQDRKKSSVNYLAYLDPDPGPNSDTEAKRMKYLDYLNP